MLNPCGANCSALHAILPLQVQWNMAFPALPAKIHGGVAAPPGMNERKLLTAPQLCERAS